jgi:hypothetical protein
MAENINIKAERVDWSNSDSIIDFYEENKLYFDNYQLIDDQDAIIDIIDMKFQYVWALIKKHRYTKALPVTDHINWLIEKIESNQEIAKKYRIENQFNIGVLKGYLKSYKDSYEIFAELIKIDSENDLYQQWYDQMKTNILTKKMNYFSFVGLVIVLGDIFSDLIFEYSFNRNVVLLGFIIMVGAWLIPYAMQKIGKAKK